MARVTVFAVKAGTLENGLIRGRPAGIGKITTVNAAFAGAGAPDYALPAGSEAIIIITDPTDGSEDGQVNFGTMVAGSFGTRMFLGAGVYMSGATGSDQGAGTINATAVYDDGVLICAPLNDGMTQEDWDALVVKGGEPVTVTETLPPSALDRALEWISFGTVKAAEREVTRVVQHATENGKHITAKRHFRMKAAGFKPGDPESFADWLREYKVVPGLIGVDEWKARMIDNGVVDKPSVAEVRERMNLALDYMALVIANLSDQNKELKERMRRGEARIAALEDKLMEKKK